MRALFCASQALVRWGGALLELAHLKQGLESTEMIHQVRAGCLGGGPELDLFRSELTPAHARRAQCISKLQKSLEINSDQAEASWCLGNAYTSLVRGLAWQAFAHACHVHVAAGHFDSPHLYGTAVNAGMACVLRVSCVLTSPRRWSSSTRQLTASGSA